MSRIEIPGEATISSDGLYRYTLYRHLSCPLRWLNPLLFIMLNPSTATATELDGDKTVPRCISFGTYWQCTSLVIVNLFALRSKSPKDLLTAADPIGPDNDFHIKNEIDKCWNGKIVCGWGTNKLAKTRVNKLRELLNGREVYCLDVNNDGSCKHPLYVKGETELRKYNL